MPKSVNRRARRVFISAPRVLLRNAGEVFRLVAFALLRPAASYLPRRWALALADAVGAILAAMPSGRSARLATQAAFGQTASPDRLAREWLTRPYRDYVVLRRVLVGREDITQWHLEHRGLERCPVLREPGQSVIVATGHIARVPTYAVYFPDVVPKKLAAVVATLDRRSVNPTSLRLRLQFGQMMDAISHARRGDVDLVEVGGRGVAGRLLEHLKQPGNLVIIAVDAPWPADRPGSFERPFAGHENQSFATGAVRLARLAQCPVVTCVSYLEDDERIVLEWSEPVPPPPAADRSADARVTSGLLDTIERAVGRHPTQYVLKIGDDRRWDPATEQWKPVRSAEGESGTLQATAETQS